MAEPIFSFLFDNMLGQLTSYVTDTSSNIATIIGGAGLSMYGIYLILWIWQFLVGNISTPAADFFKTYLKGLFIFLLATNAGWYSDWIINFFWTLPASLATEVVMPGSSFDFTYSDTGAPAVGQAFDNLLSIGYDAGLNLWEAGTNVSIFQGIMYMFLAVVVWIATVLILSYAAGLVIIGYMSLAVVLALGPLFIIFALFDSTKGLFESWLRSTINYAIYGVVLVATVSLIFSYFENYTTAVANAPDMDGATWGAVSLIGFCFLAAMIVMKADDIASSLAGGVSLGAANSLRGAGSMVNSARETIINSKYNPRGGANGNGGYVNKGALPAVARAASTVAKGTLAMFRTNGIAAKK
jgi:type IV secretion system protein VirB6